MSASITVRAGGGPAALDLLERVRARAAEIAPRVALAVQTEPALGDGVIVGGLALPTDGAALPDWHLEAAVLRALGPRHVLFLCVANSARSQMAEGIGRDLAAGDVRISSAGSAPTRVRPQAVAVLAEIGIDGGGQTSKGMLDVETDVDTVVTLCAEEVCPLWLMETPRVHWGLPDPAGAGTTPEEELQAFRDARDEIRRRLSVLFAP